MTLTPTSAPDPGLSAERPGVTLARGVCRLLKSLGFAPLTEYSPEPGLRVDVMALGPKGEIWIVECKSSRVDYLTDHKWQGYQPWCDRYFWAVGPAFPRELLPQETGVILADAWGGEILREAPEHRLAPARRTALTRNFARAAALSLHRLRDPGPAGSGR